MPHGRAHGRGSLTPIRDAPRAMGFAISHQSVANILARRAEASGGACRLTMMSACGSNSPGHKGPDFEIRLNAFLNRLSLTTPSGLGCCLPTIPHRKCLIVSRSSKIMFSNARSALTIQENGTPVRGLRS